MIDYSAVEHLPFYDSSKPSKPCEVARIVCNYPEKDRLESFFLF